MRNGLQTVNTMSETVFVKHPLIKENTVEQRLYQMVIASKSTMKNTLVVLPTSLGKTVVALLVTVARLEKAGGKIVLLAPTKPLVEQHDAFFRRVLEIDDGRIVSFSGSVRPTEREEIWENATIVIATPQVIENDLLQKRITLKDVSCIVFDEAHRTAGNYAYTYIAEKYTQTAENPHILAITASPGSDNEKITEVCKTLSIQNVIVKTENDPDVAPYVHKKEIEWLHLALPEPLKDIRSALLKMYDDQIRRLGEAGYPPQSKFIGKKDMLALQSRLAAGLRSGLAEPGDYTAMSVLAEIMKTDHAIGLIETQGAGPLCAYLEKLDHEAMLSGAGKASKRIANDLYFRQALRMSKDCETEHPKFTAVRNIISKQLAAAPDSKMIVFTNFRDTANVVADALSETEGVRPVRFVGQSSRRSDKGLTQKQQTEIIEKFREGVYNVLVATSVAEEGLDIPATDLVLFFEPVPSEIRSIQRKGRTGRFRTGRVIVLVTKETRDEAYYWSSRHKENRMLSMMKNLESMSFDETEAERTKEKDQTTFVDFVAEDEKKTDDESKEVPDTEIRPDESKEMPDTEIRPDESKEVPDTEIFTDDADPASDSEITAAVVKMPPSENDGTAPRIIVDSREMRSGIPEMLEKAGVHVDVLTMEVADYVLSDETAVERKTTADFAASLLDGQRNIFDQLLHLTKNYKNPILILEGEDDPADGRNLNPNSVSGAIVSITMDLHVSIIRTRSAEETANVLRMIAKKEQIDEKKAVNPHGKKTARTTTEQQEYMLSSIPGVGPAAAHLLLEHFGSLRSVLNASEEELTAVKGIGPKTASRIRAVVSADYKG